MELSFSLIFLSIMYLHSNGQTIDWQQTSHWKIYKIHHAGSLRLPLDSLQQFDHTELGDDSMHYYLHHMAVWPKDKTAVWMGAFTTTCELGQRIRKVDISVYGGFLFDEVSRRYYELPERFSDDWLAFLHRAMEQMSSKSEK